MTNRRTICLRIVLWLLVVLWMGLIFSFSAQNADSSREVSGRVIRWLLAILDRQFSELPPEEQLLRISVVLRGAQARSFFFVRQDGGSGLRGVLSGSAAPAGVPRGLRPGHCTGRSRRGPAGIRARPLLRVSGYVHRRRGGTPGCGVSIADTAFDTTKKA